LDDCCFKCGTFSEVGSGDVLAVGFGAELAFRNKLQNNVDYHRKLQQWNDHTVLFHEMRIGGHGSRAIIATSA
jgi:hypothetical protein